MRVRTTPWGLLAEPPRAEQGILFFPAAGGTAFETWNQVLAAGADLFEQSATRVFVYEPLFRAGFYLDPREVRRIRGILNRVPAGFPLVFAGGSMGAFGAIRLASLVYDWNASRVAGVYAVSPVLSLEWACQKGLEIPELRPLAEELRSQAGPDLPSEVLSKYLDQLPQGLPLSIVFGGADDLIGSEFHRIRLRRWMALESPCRCWVLEVPGAGHGMAWDLEGLIAFVRGCSRRRVL